MRDGLMALHGSSPETDDGFIGIAEVATAREAMGSTDGYRIAGVRHVSRTATGSIVPIHHHARMPAPCGAAVPWRPCPPVAGAPRPR